MPGMIFALLLSLSAVLRAQVYIGDADRENVADYDQKTGVVVNPNLVTGVNQPSGMAIAGGASGNMLLVANYTGSNSTVGKYNAATGAAINAGFLSGLAYPNAIAVSGNTVYVANYPGGKPTVSTFSLSTGAVMKPNFITLSGSDGYFDSFAFSGNTMYVVGADPSTGNGVIGEYDATTGAAINADFITGIPSQDVSIAVSGNELFVPDPFGGSVALYNATTGALESGDFTSGIASPFSVAVSGGILYELDESLLSVSEWNAATGALIDKDFITNLDDPYSMAVVPEPLAGTALLAGLCASGFRRLRARRRETPTSRSG